MPSPAAGRTSASHGGRETANLRYRLQSAFRDGRLSCRSKALKNICPDAVGGGMTEGTQADVGVDEIAARPAHGGSARRAPRGTVRSP